MEEQPWRELQFWRTFVDTAFNIRSLNVARQAILGRRMFSQGRPNRSTRYRNWPWENFYGWTAPHPRGGVSEESQARAADSRIIASTLNVFLARFRLHTRENRTNRSIDTNWHIALLWLGDCKKYIKCFFRK